MLIFIAQRKVWIAGDKKIKVCIVHVFADAVKDKRQKLCKVLFVIFVFSVVILNSQKRDYWVFGVAISSPKNSAGIFYFFVCHSFSSPNMAVKNLALKPSDAVRNPP